MERSWSAEFSPTIGGQTRNRIARLDPATGLADSFNPNANGVVWTVALQADGKILAGGDFNGTNSIGGQTRNRIARLDPATGAADSFNPNANSTVNVIAVQPDGQILAGGNFNGTNSIGGQPRNHIARLNPTSGLADSFNPNAVAGVLAIAVQSDGKILIGGNFTTLAPNGGASVTRHDIARLERDGRVDQTLNLNMVGQYVGAIAVQPDGKVLIGGDFTTVLGVSQAYLARLNTDGTLDLSFQPFPDGIVRAIVLQPDGQIIVGGQFRFIGGQTRHYIARLGAPTGLADSFNPNASDSIYCIALQADGKILAGGNFIGANSIGGQMRNHIARLNATNGTADSFDPNPNDFVDTIVLQSDGKILVGGDFTSIGGQTRNRIARLDPATGLADSLDPNPNGDVEAIAVQPDGKILAGGTFTTVGGQTRNRIARLDPDTGSPDLFSPNPNSDVDTIAIQSDGKILVGGAFSNIAGQPRNHIARLDASTGMPDSLLPSANFQVNAIALQPDGKILAGGYFTSIGGQSRNYFARLNNDTPALQNLAATPTSITWTRGGSSPQFALVTFEASTDNVSYSLLGNATATGSNWTLTGFTFVVGHNLYVRARGYYRSGWNNGSESTSESVRNIFLTLPPSPGAVVSRKEHGGAGVFDINLPLSGDPGIECRGGGASNDYQIVFSFPNSVTFTNASVTAGAGSVSGSSGSGTSNIIVNLTGVTNAQRLTLALLGASDGTNTGDLSVQMGVLLGDTNGNGSANATDVSQAKAQSGNPVTGSNFREDVNTNGAINASDVSAVKLASGTALP